MLSDKIFYFLLPITMFLLSWAECYLGISCMSKYGLLKQIAEVTHLVSLRIGTERTFLRRIFSTSDSWSVACAIERHKCTNDLSHRRLVNNYNR